jgi:hypothetical protein
MKFSAYEDSPRTESESEREFIRNPIGIRSTSFIAFA